MNAPPTSPETLLIGQVARRDRAALSQLYDRYARVLYALAFKILGSVEESEEVVLDVFSQVWRTADRYDSARSRVDSWLFLITRSRSLDRLRKRQRQAKTIEASTVAARVESSVSVASPEEELYVSQRREQVLAALAQLPEEQRTAIELSYYQGLTQSEIADRMGTALGTVKTRIRLGLSKLRGILESS